MDWIAVQIAQLHVYLQSVASHTHTHTHTHTHARARIYNIVIQN